jgi:hypothetical protein
LKENLDAMYEILFHFTDKQHWTLLTFFIYSVLAQITDPLGKFVLKILAKITDKASNA